MPPQKKQADSGFFNGGSVQPVRTLKLYDDDAERSVLSSVLLDPSMAVSLLSELSPEDFFIEKNRLLFELFRSLQDENIAIDTISAMDRIEKRGLEAVGCTNMFLADLCNSIPIESVTASHAKIVKDYSIIRDLHLAAQSILTDISFNPEDAESLLGKAEQRIFSIGEQSVAAKGFVSISEFVKVGHENIKAMIGRGTALTGLSTGFNELDHYTTGFHPGQLIIIAARPSIGKTTLALNMAELIAEKGRGVGFFSLEMSGDQLAQRMISTRSEISARSLIDGMAPDRHIRDIDRAAMEISKMPIYVDDRAGLTAREIRGAARRLKKQHDIEIIFVDYLQLMTGDGETREREIAYISGEMKAMSKELGVPVIVLSQLNRKVIDRSGAPRLSDLRESGAIEQDADMVLFLHDAHSQSGEIDGTDNSPRELQLIIGKQRNGPRVIMPIQFNPSITKFSQCGKPMEGD